MKFITELKRDHLVNVGLTAKVVDACSAEQVESLAETMKFEQPKSYLTLHTPKKGKGKGDEYVYMVTGKKWDRLCKGSKINQDEIREKLGELDKFRAQLASFLK